MHTDLKGNESTYCLCRRCGNREWVKEFSDEYAQVKTYEEMHALNIQFCDIMAVQCERRVDAKAGSVVVKHLIRGLHP